MFDETEEIVLTAIVGVGLILFLASVFIFSIVRYSRRVTKDIEEKLMMKKQFEQELLQSKLETQEDTFQLIAKELHDNVGQLLSTTKMLLGVTERSMKEVPDTLQTAHATLGKAIHEIRSLSKALDKEWLEQFNLVDNLQSEVARINAGNIVKVTCTYPEDSKLRTDEQIILFRIIQEALQNAIKHGNPSSINITVRSDEKNMLITITDNGNGFDEKTHFPGMGITNMRNRTVLLGGNITWKSFPGSGTIITIHLPVKSQTDEN